MLDDMKESFYQTFFFTKIQLPIQSASISGKVCPKMSWTSSSTPPSPRLIRTKQISNPLKIDSSFTQDSLHRRFSSVILEKHYSPAESLLVQFLPALAMGSSTRKRSQPVKDKLEARAGVSNSHGHGIVT